MKMFEYKCTNNKVDFEEEYDSNLVLEEHNDEEEVAFLLELCNRVDFYELISSEPLYYLNLLETRQELVGLLQDYELFFIRESASDGCKDNLRIRFKIMKTDQFTEVGFFSEADDKTTYQEFIIQCKRLLKRPVIKNTIQEDEKDINNNEISNPIALQLEDNVMDEMMNSEDIFKDYSAAFKVPEQKNNTINGASSSSNNNNININNINNNRLKDLKDLQDTQDLQDLQRLKNLRACCPKQYLNDYDKMLLNMEFNKKRLQVPSKKLYQGLLEVYKNTDDDAVKYEIDNFLFTNNGHLYAKQ